MHFFNPLEMFNILVLELGSSYVTQGRNFNSCSERSHKAKAGQLPEGEAR